MGRTAFSGPAFGAKSLLWSVSADNVVISTAIQTEASIVVPAGEDWYVTEMHVHRGSTGSTAFVATLVDDTTNVATVAIASSAADVAGSTRPTPDGGEFAGVQVLSGSSVSFRVTNGNSSVVGSSKVYAWVYGFPRWLQTDTRAF
jgi:hypothetical protein